MPKEEDVKELSETAFRKDLSECMARSTFNADIKAMKEAIIGGVFGGHSGAFLGFSAMLAYHNITMDKEVCQCMVSKGYENFKVSK